jgi:hypothetical protein
VNAVDFETAPAVGTVLRLDDQEYELVAVEPYRRKDGSPSNLLHWRSDCPVCGSPFDAASGLRCAGIARRCAAHRDARKPVKGKRGRKVVVTVVPA